MKHKNEIWLQIFKVSETWQEKWKKMSTGSVRTLQQLQLRWHTATAGVEADMFGQNYYNWSTNYIFGPKIG